MYDASDDMFGKYEVGGCKYDEVSYIYDCSDMLHHGTPIDWLQRPVQVMVAISQPRRTMVAVRGGSTIKKFYSDCLPGAATAAHQV